MHVASTTTTMAADVYPEANGRLHEMVALGDGELMMVRFTARGQSGQTGDLTIADARAWTFQDILEMRVTPKNGSVVLITTRAAIPTPLLLLAGGLVLIVGLVLVFRPRRSPRRPSAPTRAHPARHYS